MIHPNKESTLIEHPARGLFAALGCTMVSLFQTLRHTRDLLLPRLMEGKSILRRIESWFLLKTTI